MKDARQVTHEFPLIGHLVDLRLIEATDADFVHGLRTNEDLARHLHPVSGTAADQRQWIETYKSREQAGTEFYFVILRKDVTPCGLVRLYDVLPSRFTWGSIILHPDRPALAALEATVLSMAFGFETLDCRIAELDVRRANTHATAFYRRLGMRQVSEDDVDLFFEMTREEFTSRRPELDAAVLASASREPARRP